MKTQSGSSTKAVTSPWKGATGSPGAPVYPTPLCCRSSNVLLHSLPPSTSQDLSTKDTSVNPLAVLQFLTAVKPLHGKKRTFPRLGIPRHFPNSNKWTDFLLRWLIPHEGECREENHAELTVVCKCLGFTAVHIRFPGFSEMWACRDRRGLLCWQVSPTCNYFIQDLGLS